MEKSYWDAKVSNNRLPKVFFLHHSSNRIKSAHFGWRGKNFLNPGSSQGKRSNLALFSGQRPAKKSVDGQVGLGRQSQP